MRAFSLIFVLLIFASGALAQRTSRGKLKLDEKIVRVQPSEAIDTIFLVSDSVSFYGYEKAQISTSESFFVSNGWCRNICGINFSISYLDHKGRLLHSRTESVACDIPIGETRSVSIKSWDKQKLWYYVNSQARHNDYCSPFDVRMSLNFVLSLPENESVNE